MSQSANLCESPCGPVLLKPVHYFVRCMECTMSGPVWKVAVNINFDFLSFAIWQNFRKKMNEDVHNFPDDAHSIFSDVQTRL